MATETHLAMSVLKMPFGVPSVAQRVKNPTAAAPVMAEVWIQSLALCSQPHKWVKGSGIATAVATSIPGLGTPYAMGVAIKKNVPLLLPSLLLSPSYLMKLQQNHFLCPKFKHRCPQ